MAEVVVDTNVWVMVDKISDIAKLTRTELDCVDACRTWLRTFAESDNKLVVDSGITRLILNEYRRSISQQGLARNLLNRLERMPRERLVEVEITLDQNRHAVVPDHLMIDDEDDRKFIAVALAHHPTPPIIDATDTDWTKEREKLTAYGLIIQELCPNYIQEKLSGKS